MLFMSKNFERIINNTLQQNNIFIIHLYIYKTYTKIKLVYILKQQFWNKFPGVLKPHNTYVIIIITLPLRVHLLICYISSQRKFNFDVNKRISVLVIPHK